MNITLITIGNELLKGRIVNGNAAVAGQMLRQEGFSLTRTLVVGDDPAEIKAAIEAEWQLSQAVITCGGLGPTNDDRTKKVLADWMGSTLAMHQPTLRWLEERYARQGRTLNERTRDQALVPQNAIVLTNKQGTAPGLATVKENKVLAAIPGVPHEFAHLMETGVIPLLKQNLRAQHFGQRILRLESISESEAALRFEAIENDLPPGIEVAWLPRDDGLWVELFGHCPRGKGVVSEFEKNLDIAEELAKNCYASVYLSSGDAPLARMIADICWKEKLSLAVAESLTGGRVAAAIVSISGVSSFFRGSITAYDTQVKIDLLDVPASTIDTHGVVSEAVALAMAEGVRRKLKADIGLATTGLAEADAERPAQAWLGFSSAHKQSARHILLRYGREVNLTRCTNYLLQFALKNLQSQS